VQDKVEQLLAAQDITYPSDDPDELVRSVATGLNLDFIEIDNNYDLQHLPSRLPFESESVVALLQMLLHSKDTYAVTISRKARANWEQPLLAIIDCRFGKDSFLRGLFSKWHEIAHLLLDEQKSECVFRRSADYPRDPEEILVDRIAWIFYLPVVAGSFRAALYESLIPFLWRPRPFFILLTTPLILYMRIVLEVLLGISKIKKREGARSQN
jgi:hypothetical protein